MTSAQEKKITIEYLKKLSEISKLTDLRKLLKPLLMIKMLKRYPYNGTGSKVDIQFYDKQISILEKAIQSKIAK